MAQRNCSVNGCERQATSRGWCPPHYERWKRTGDPLGSTRRSPEERFWAKVDKTDECWLWTAYRSERGYGIFKAGRKVVKAHRFAYENLVGPIPEGLELDHLCRVHACVRPDHLEPVTHAENVRRGDSWKIMGTKTHCLRGHPFDEANTYYMLSRRGRSCRACSKIHAERARSRTAWPSSV